MTIAPVRNRIGDLADRPAFGRRNGDRYLATDTLEAFEWNGAAWITVDNLIKGWSFGANMIASSASQTFTNGMPRFVFPDAAQTDAFVVMGFPLSWLNGLITIGFDWVNDDIATGDVRWEFELRENTIGGSIATPDIALDTQATIASPVADGGITTSVAATGVVLTPAAFGSLYSLRISRLGADAADTLTGPVGFAEIAIIPETI